MSGAIVIDGMDRYFPEIKNMKEKILILRDAELKQGDPSSALLTGAVELAPYGYGAATGKPTRVFTVNGVVRPKITIAYGKSSFGVS
jgi:suppressor of ftsI